MIETIINLRDRDLWPKRKLRFEDAVAQTRVALDALISKGILNGPAGEAERDRLAGEVAMAVAGRVDDVAANWRTSEWRNWGEVPTMSLAKLAGSRKR